MNYRAMEELRVSINDLAKACAHSSNAAEWADFLRRCTPLASLVVSRVSRMWMNFSSPAITDDIVQEIFLKLCEQERRILRDFEPRGEDSFMGLLRIVSASVANDYFRRLNSAKRGGKVVTSALAEDAPPNHAAIFRDDRKIQQAVLYSQLDKKMRAAPQAIAERDRTIFWLYYRQGFTAEEIAGMTGAGLSPKGVESALRRVTKWVRAEIERRRPGEET